MNSRLADLLTKQVTQRVLGGGTPTTEDGEPGQLPPFVSGLLAKFGITPETITAYAEAIKGGVQAIQYNTQLAVEQNKVIIGNQRVLHEKLEMIETKLDRLNPEAASLAPIPGFEDGTPNKAAEVDGILDVITVIDLAENMDPSKHN